MDHSLVANYSFNDQYNELKYDSGALNNHLHIESGYESLLAISSNSTSFFLSNSNSNDSSEDSSLFSLPATPVKSKTPVKSHFIYNGNNCSTTPDFKQQYVADVNSFYFQSIKSSYDSTGPISSGSSSDVSQSPKTSMYCSNADSYMHRRDNLNSKLLRSPAFKLEDSHSPQQLSYIPSERPNIKSFSSRFLSEMPKFEQLPLNKDIPKSTPTEAEFMGMLISNHHIPDNPEFLIGRRMGIEKVNILGELNMRSMNNVMDKIFAYMNVGDVVRTACVSKEWRSCVKNSIKINKDRVRFIKTKRFVYETTKENHIQMSNEANHYMDTKRKFREMDATEKRNMFKSGHKIHNVEMDQSNDNDQSMTENTIFNSLDVNRLNNINNQTNHHKRILERQFREFSIKDETVFRISPMKKRSPVKRLSPIKRYSPIKCANVATPLICSKKSKRNLKRL